MSGTEFVLSVIIFFMSDTLCNEAARSIITGDKVLLGVSGGSDSMAMLHIFQTLSRTVPFTCAVAHLHHGIRGRHADKDRELVQRVAEMYGIPCHIKEVDVPALARTGKMSLEDAARRSRYAFFEQLCAGHGYTKVALAHTLNDSTETVLMKLLRGTGLKGLCGIARSRPLKAGTDIIRPLLSFTKKDLLTYCREQRIPWHEDRTNTDTDLLRNDLRRNVLPRLRKLNPNLDNTLASMADVLSEEDRYMDDIARRTFEAVMQKRTANGVRLDIRELLSFPKAVQRRTVRLALELVQGDLQDIYLPFIENFLDNGLTTITHDRSGKLKVSKERL